MGESMANLDEDARLFHHHDMYVPKVYLLQIAILRIELAKRYVSIYLAAS